MYPNLYYLFRDWFGAGERLRGLRFINMFGFMVALAFIAAAIVLTAELKRKSKEGLLHSEEQKIMVGKPASFAEMLVNFLLGFILGYKIIGAFLTDGNVNIQEFIFSREGNWTVGILLGLVFAGLKWWEKNKQKLAKPEERVIRIWPHDRVGDVVIFAAIFGFAGAKIFDNLENWDRFIEHPIENLFSPSGLTFYGGLICAALAIWWYARKHKIGFWHLNDAAAPALMLAYAVGRIGCQVSGDGDWGIVNSAYVTDANAKVVVAAPGQFEQALEQHKNYFINSQTSITSLDQVKHLGFKGPSFLPDWIFAYTYPHNVNKEGVKLPVCDWDEYCNALPLPVFPTPLYEIIVGFILFLIIWSLRKRLKVPGTLFGFYLLLNGLERFFIEKIRVNTHYESFPFQPTQAEIISFLLVITGITLMIYLPRKAKSKTLA